MFILGRLKHLFMIGAVILVALFFKWNGRISPAEEIFYRLNGSAVRAGQAAAPAQDSAKSEKLISELTAKNIRLEYRLYIARRELERMKALQGMREGLLPGYSDGKLARVTGRAPGSWHSEIIADSGYSEGVTKGDIAIASGGLAGKVVRAGSGACVIKLLTAIGPSTGGVVDGGDAYGIVTGDGRGGLTLESAPSDAKIKKGDRIITSGFGGLYPYGITIGTVRRVKKRPDMLSPLVEIEPAAPLAKLYYVVIFDN